MSSTEIDTESITLPILAVVTGFIFLLANEYFLEKGSFIAMATIALVLGCTFLAVHPLIGNDTEKRKVIEAILSIIITLVTFSTANFYKIEVWDTDLVSDITAMLCLLSIISLIISLSKAQKSSK